MISVKDMKFIKEWVTEVAIEEIVYCQRKTFLQIVDRFLEEYLNDQELADGSTYQLLTLGCLRAVSCLTSSNDPFGVDLQSDLCQHIYSPENLVDSNELFILWLIERRATVESAGVKKELLHVSDKSMVFFTEDKIVVKCIPHFHGTIELMAHALLSPSNNIVTLLGGTILEHRVELFYTYLPLELHPSVFNHSSVVRTVIRDIVQGVQVLHSAGLAHRDLKFENIRITKEGRTTLIDLDGVGYGPRFTDVVTSIVTRAPEILRREIDQVSEEVYDPKTLDMWSLGILALELANGSSLPVPDAVDATKMLKVLDVHLPTLLLSQKVQDNLGEDLFQLVQNCVSYNPLLRPDIADFQVTEF
jgi:serine/threonine protein kinase